MRKIIKFLMLMSFLKGYHSYYGIIKGASDPVEQKAKPGIEHKIDSKDEVKNWWTSFRKRLGSRRDDSPKTKMQSEPVPAKNIDLGSGVGFSNGPDLPKVISKRSQKSSKDPVEKKSKSTAKNNSQDALSQSDLFEVEVNRYSDLQGKGFEQGVKAANSEFDLMNKTKDSLFDEFKILKSDKGIQTFKNLSKQDIKNRVKKSVDEISVKVGLSVDQERHLEIIMEDNLFEIQLKLKNKLIAQTPEEVVRALFNGVQHDDRWSEFAFKDKQQRDNFEDYVMSRAKTMKNSSLLEDYLRVCSNMAKKAEGAAADAREIGEFSQGSTVNKFKVGVHRIKAGFYMAANPCILAVFMLGLVGEFIYSKV